jgi:hypothetical protein
VNKFRRRGKPERLPGLNLAFWGYISKKFWSLSVSELTFLDVFFQILSKRNKTQIHKYYRVHIQGVSKMHRQVSGVSSLRQKRDRNCNVKICPQKLIFRGTVPDHVGFSPLEFMYKNTYQP